MTCKTPSHFISMMVLAGLLLGYFFLFMMHEQRTSHTTTDISPSLPTSILNLLGHNYLNQFTAEALFIKTAVYYGGLNQRMNENNLEIMAQHLITMGKLHPRLLDIYYRSESVLAHRGKIYAETTNQILETGRAYLPNQLALPFFEGFNHFHYLNDPVKAGEVLRIASNIPNSPQWIGHLASMLMASGGNIRTGLIWLKGMLAASNDEDEKKRYNKEILAFEKAMVIQLALDEYTRKHGLYPESLSDLSPNFLHTIPQMDDHFQLVYQAPKLFLNRSPHE